jgi:hypothetical protein
MLERLRRGELAGQRALDLSGCGLTAFPPEIFGLADTLEVLDLGRNPLSALPDDLGQLHRLRVLFASGTRFRVLPPCLGDCAALTQIGFRASGIEIVPAEALPPALRWLTLTDNRIEALPDAIGERASLAKLMLSGNRLARLPETLAGAGSLELLRIAANRFETLPGFLSALPRLAWLAFAGNPAEPGVARIPGPFAPWRALRLGALLGEGASGIVHAADWDRPETVAVKLYKGAMTSDGLPEREIEAALAVGAHPHLLGGLARIEDHPDGAAGLVLRRLPDDWQVLAGPPSLESCSRDVYPTDMALPAGAAFRIAHAVASAGLALHVRGWLHGDLYAHNIHWDPDGHGAVLGDFGAAARIPPGAGLEAFDVLAWGILADELLAHAPDGEMNDRLRALKDAASQACPHARPCFEAIVDGLGSVV